MLRMTHPPASRIFNRGDELYRYPLDGLIFLLMGKISYKLSDRINLSTPNGSHKGYGAASRDDIFINSDLAVDEDENVVEMGIKSRVGSDNLPLKIRDGAIGSDLQRDCIHPGFIFQV